MQLVRLNLNEQPEDVVEEVQDVVGRRAKGRIGAGQVFRKKMLDIPPVIPKGAKVQIVYRRGGLSASASAVAIEDGFEGGKVRVRNEGSKKIVVGRVVSVEEVEVTPED